ncbi:hypothetical protein [Candidatus Korarchaeum cryptofilum]|uniref:Uncharacterized protein n=1 Tax=Korarchaeum cryptofilum (strain OPF8) TaxID=374847 RepID=B1L501_KORCO|nr:hypothetical protein [Candidatus Korarchaeum cryptofilum]ACB07530.1 conserved hypothetical protein [Candidatus Korarchaeum cryptofilum OPF8]
MFPGEELLTLLSSLLLLSISIYKYLKSKEISYAMWSIAALSFLIIAAALALLKLDALSLPITPYVGALYPAFMAAGVLGKDHWRKYVIFILLMLLLMVIGQLSYKLIFTGAEVILHSVSGLIITFLPFIIVARRRAPPTESLIGLGGLLISIGGLALTTLLAQKPLLPMETVIFLLHPLLFLSAFLMAAGIYLCRRG